MQGASSAAGVGATPVRRTKRESAARAQVRALQVVLVLLPRRIPRRLLTLERTNPRAHTQHGAA